MSAAEPVDPRPIINATGDAAVIDISTRHGSRRRRKPVSNPADSGSDPGPGGRSPQELLAEHFEATFNHHRLTLTDETTATAYTVTLQIVRGMLKGAQAQGMISEEQCLEVDQLIEGMGVAPGILNV